MGGALGKDDESPVIETKLEAMMSEAMRKRASKGTTVKSFNTIILKFPKIDESFSKCRTIFEQFDEDKNGGIDHGELKNCFRKLEISLTDEEIDEIFKECDINEDKRVEFKEFIVLLCLVYLLKKEQTPTEVKAQMGLDNLEATFETLIDSFTFLDKNKDGYVSKAEMIDAINETTRGERSSGRIGMKRFEEMDWDKNGMVNFKEFLFAFTRWVGVDEADDEEEDDAEKEDDDEEA